MAYRMRLADIRYNDLKRKVAVELEASETALTEVKLKNMQEIEL
jgi:hypothetical protein